MTPSIRRARWTHAARSRTTRARRVPRCALRWLRLIGCAAVVAGWTWSEVRATPPANEVPAPAANAADGAANDGAAEGAHADPKDREWRPPTAADARREALDWLGRQGVEAGVVARGETLWADVPAPSGNAEADASGAAPGEVEVLERLAQTFALADPRAAELVKLCGEPSPPVKLPPQAWLTAAAAPGAADTAPLLTRNLRLYYGRWLAQHQLYDEAAQQLDGLSPGEVVAPATLLFFQSVVHHSLLERDAGLRSIAVLLGGPAGGPQRYVAVARLMEEDLKSLDDESLDHVARRMGDVRRRLDLGRAGEKVRDEQKGIIDSLDKMIKKMEDQQRQQGGAAGAAQDSIRSQSPAGDSTPMGGKGPGDVTERDIGSQADWGDLPPAEREEALQRIGRDFPTHYRDVIEQYFRRLSADADRGNRTPEN